MVKNYTFRKVFIVQSLICKYKYTNFSKLGSFQKTFSETTPLLFFQEGVGKLMFPIISRFLGVV